MQRLILAALVASALGTTARAADRPGRLVVDIKIDGSGHQAKDRAHSKFVTTESLHTAFTLLGGDPEDINRLDNDGNGTPVQGPVNAVYARVPLRSARPATAGASAGRFVTYSAADPDYCKPEYIARIRNETDGVIPDVQGLVPFTTRTFADFKASNMQSLPLCSAMLVLDKNANKIFLSMHHAEVLGSVKRTEGGRVRVDERNVGVRLNQEALEWVAKTLNGAAKSGRECTTLKIPTSSTLGGTGEKTINVEVTWKFES